MYSGNKGKGGCEGKKKGKRKREEGEGQEVGPPTFCLLPTTMFSSTNVILRAASCIVRNRFLSVDSQYGITACTISQYGIKLDSFYRVF